MLLRTLATLCLATAPLALAQAPLAERVRSALDRARPALLSHLEAAQPAGELLLVTYAALHDGVKPTDPVLAAALDRVAKARLATTYELALRLMVLAADAEFPERDDLSRKDLEELLDHQSGGVFGYTANGGGGDLSNTQYGVLGLRAAASMGRTVPERTWQRIESAVAGWQNKDGGWGYSGRGQASYASMTAAGIAVLQVCRTALGKRSEGDARRKQRIEDGWEWFATNPRDIGNWNAHWCLYFHYGLERAAILSDLQVVGTVDWYAVGAEMLLRQQLDGGGWASAQEGLHARPGEPGRGNAVSTAFAVLFLRRAFQKVPGPLTGGRAPSLPMLGESSTPQEVRACGEELAGRGVLGLEIVLKALRDPLLQRRQAAHTALLAVCGEDFGYDPQRDAEANAVALRKADLWYLRNR
ncbi:MAG: hypothetical protein RL148_3207 [Planctomycetota bacterium]